MPPREREREREMSASQRQFVNGSLENGASIKGLLDNWIVKGLHGHGSAGNGNILTSVAVVMCLLYNTL
eukprot:scaffold586_cov112-Skeletonema_dohrnii-CCMP3373.AAC.2